MGDKLKMVLEYSTLYPDEPKPNIDALIQQLSRSTIIRLVVVLTKLYSNADISSVTHFFENKAVLQEIINRVSAYCNPYTEYIFLPLQTALRILRKAVSLPYVATNQFSDATELQLFKAILWINEQEMHIENMTNNVAEIVFIQSLITNISNVSPEIYKERALLQSYSAYMFFLFIEAKAQTDHQLKQIYEAFLRKYGVQSGIEYVFTLFCVVIMTKNEVGTIHRSLEIDEDHLLTRHLIDELTLDLNVYSTDAHADGRNNNVDYRTFRNKPFIRDEEGNYVIFWMEGLIDRMYNSLYFEFNDINERLGLKYQMCHLITDDFSEKYFFNTLMNKANKNNLYVPSFNFVGQDNGKADYVLKRDHTIIIFECKDVRISGDVIESHDAKKILEEYRNKFFSKKYSTNNRGERKMRKKPKAQGVGQLIEYMSQARAGDPYYGGNQDSIIYPVLIVCDYKLLQRGIQQIMDGWYAERKGKSPYDKPLIVMSFITLIKSYPLFAREGFEYYFERYRTFINSIQDPGDLRKYLTFDDYMQEYGENMEISEIRDEFMSALEQNYKSSHRNES